MYCTSRRKGHNLNVYRINQLFIHSSSRSFFSRITVIIPRNIQQRKYSLLSLVCRINQQNLKILISALFTYPLSSTWENGYKIYREVLIIFGPTIGKNCRTLERAAEISDMQLFNKRDSSGFLWICQVDVPQNFDTSAACAVHPQTHASPLPTAKSGIKKKKP